MNTIRSIKTKKDHADALKLLEELIDENPKSGTDESGRLWALAVAIEKYEKEHFPMPPADPAEVIKYEMDQYGLL